ncbi:hypothetical protein KSF78_0002626 [Schistosoma japonicum]|nr:hypothetical protein KSF78_0002626 [Schistosoma japonicum]
MNTIQSNSGIIDLGPTPQELINEFNWSGKSNEDYLMNLNASVMAESTQLKKNQLRRLKKMNL